MTTTLLLAACDSGGSGMDNGGGSVNASAQTQVLSEQRGIPVPDATIDFKAGSNQGTDATGQDGIARFSYDVPESNTPSNISISGNSPDIQEFSQTETWQPEVRTKSITREQQRSAAFDLNTSRGSRPVNVSYTVLDNKGDGDGGDLTLSEGTTGSNGSTTVNFDYLSLTDSVHVQASRSTSQPSITAKTTTIDDLEPAIVRDTIRSSPAEPTTPSEQPDRVKRLKQEEDRTTPRENQSERETITDPAGQPRTPVEVNLQRKKQGITTEYSDHQSSTSIDTTVAIDNLDDLTLRFDDQRPDQRTVTLQGSLNDADTEQGYNGGSITITNLDDLTERGALTDAQGDFETTFNDVTNTFNAKITTDVNEYTQAADTITVTPPVNNADTTITAPTLTIQRDTYDATTTAQGSDGDKVAGAKGELSGDGTSLTSFTTGQDGTATRDVTTTADSLTAIVNKAGWRQGTTTKALLSNRNITLDANLDLIEYTVNAEAKDESGNPVDVNVTVDDQDGNTFTKSTGSDGQTTFTDLNITNGFQENESVIVTYNNDEYNAKQDTVTLDPDNTTTSSTVTLTPSETTVNYTVEGDATSSDGDTLADPQIHLVSPNDDTVATTTPDNTGFYAMNTTQEELNGGNQAGLASNPPGYETFTKDITLSQGTNKQNITLQEILRDFTFDVNENDGTIVADASIDIDEDEGGQYRDITTLTTGSNGETTTTLSVDEQVISGDDLRITINKEGYNAVEFSHTVAEEKKTFTKELTEQQNTVSATITGNTDQEGQTLPNADITFANADADTTIGTTTTDNNGDYTFTTTYPDDQAYQLDIKANTGDHEAKTKSITLGSSNNTYTADVDLERLIYDVTINTEDANTDSPVSASGTITTDGTTLANYTTGSDGKTTVEINTDAEQATSKADTKNYNPHMANVGLGGAEDVSVTNNLPPIAYAYNGTIIDGNGDQVSDAEITVDDRDGNQVSTTTASNGDYSVTVDVNDGVTEGETLDITADKAGFNNDETTTTANPNDRTKTKDFTITEQSNTVTATFTGGTDQEGQTLPNADITIRNADADTTVGTTTSNTNGEYAFTTSYPDDQAYTASIIANTPDHQADTTTVSLGTSDNTYSNDFNLERLIYDITVNTDDANTTNAVNAEGTISNNGASLTSYTTGTDGETTVRVNTGADQVTNEADTTNYEETTGQLSLAGSEDITTALSLTPVQYTFTGNVDGENGDLNDANITVDDGDGNQLTTTTNASGDFTLDATVNDGVTSGENIDITADKKEYNASTKTRSVSEAEPTTTADFALSEATTTYTVEGDVTSSDGDTVTNTTINLQDPNGPTVDTDQTSTDGFYTTSTTQDELGGNTASLASNPDGYDPYTESLTLNEGTNTQNITLQEILRDYIFDVNENDGTAVADASIDIDEDEGGQYRDITTLTTGSNGETTTTLSVDEQVISGDDLRITINKEGYNATTFTHTVNEETKTFTKSLSEETTTVTATINGTTTQEGQTLPNADITFANADADTTVGTTTTDNNGDYTFTTSYPDDQAYQLDIKANTGDHEAKTKNVTLNTTDDTYTADVDLERLIYDVTINTEDANTGSAVNATGSILNNGTSLTSYTTGTDGQTTVEINTRTDQVTNEANTANYDPNTQDITLGGTEDLTVTNDLPPIQYTFTGNVDDTSGDLANADITLTDQDNNTLTTTTNTSGDYTVTGTINDGLQENETIDITADKTNYNGSTKQTTADPNNRTKTTNFNLTPTTTSYKVEGDVTSSDGDTVTNTTINLQDPNGTTVATDKTNTRGSYEANTTQNELGGDQARLASNPAGYNAYNEDITLSEGTNTQNITLQEILRDYQFNVSDQDNNGLDNVTIDINETTTGDRDVTTLTTDGSGNASTTLSVDEQIINGDDLRITINKEGYKSSTVTDEVDTESETINVDLAEETQTVSATITGNTDQEGQTLPNADITFANADADTTVGTTTSDSNGDYTFSTSYPDDQAYTLKIKANKGDHADKTKTVNLGTNDQTITQDFDLERLIYDITINTNDANTNNAVNASGNITANGTNLANYTTGSNGQTTVQINTATNNISSEANTTNYDPSTESITLGGSEDITVTNALPPIEYTFTGNVDGDNGDLSGADVSIEDQDGNQLTTTTNQAGDYNLTGTVNDGLEENETISITANDTDFGASTKQTTVDPDDRDKTTNFTLTPTTVNYTVEGDVTSSDGDTVTTATININEPNGPTVASDNTGTNGFYSASTTQGELDGDKADIQTNVAGYDAYNEDITLSEGTNTQNITLQEILRDYQFNTEDTNGNTLSNVTIDIDENEGGQYRDVTTLTTDGSGNASTTLSVDEQIINGDELRFTANKNEYNNAETTDIVDTETETITLALDEQTTTYNISGTLTDEDGDKLVNKDILIQTTSDNTVATTTTTSDGSYSVSVTQDELGGDTGEVEANPTGYNKVETTKTFNDGTNTVDLTLPLTEYTRTFNVDDANGSALANASIDADETTSGDRDVFTASTNTSGEHAEVLTIDDMVVDGDQLEYQFNKDGYNAATKTETLTDTTKTINVSLDEQNTTDRITITFNPKTVGNSLYSGGYSGELDYTVSTNDTTFTTSGSITADVPISDGDDLEISHGDQEYISTFAVNNTDTEQPPFQVSGFPDEPDYQSSSTVSIPKSDIVSQYQIRGIPSTSPEGKDTKSTYGGDLGAGRWTTRDGYDGIKGIITTTRIDNGDDVPQSVIDRMSQEFSTATSQMPFLPITQTQKTFSEVQDIFDNRGVNFNYTAIDGGVPSNNTTVSQGYAERARSTYSENSATNDIREEVYESFTGANNLPVYTSNGFNDDGKWIPRVIYSLESQNTF